MKNISRELVSASAIMIILSVLQNGDNFGYEILRMVKKITNEEVVWQEASIYPLLKKMEKKGLIKSHWKIIKNERPRKYYSILANGRKQLNKNKQEWQRMNKFLQNLWDAS